MAKKTEPQQNEPVEQQDKQPEVETVKADKTEKSVKAEKVEKSEKKELKKAAAEIEQLKQQLEQAKDALLRTAAEFDNFKKREIANREKTAGFVKGETIKALLPAIDNINRALEADESSADYAKGVAMTVKSLIDALEKLGLSVINPVGEQFDVNFHQAVMRVEDESVGENVVTQVMQPGYMLGDTVLRHAMVKVANCD